MTNQLFNDEPYTILIEVARQFEKGQATGKELRAAWDAVWDTAMDKEMNGTFDIDEGDN